MSIQIDFEVGSSKEKGLVFLRFSQPFQILAMAPADAMKMARLLMDHARKVPQLPPKDDNGGLITDPKTALQLKREADKRIRWKDDKQKPR